MLRGRRYRLSQPKGFQKGWHALSREERNELTQFFKLLGGILATAFLLYWVAVTGLPGLGSFWSFFRGEGGGTAGDTTPPAPPTFAPQPAYTNVAKIDLSGYAEGGAEVTLYINDAEVAKTIAEAGGTFSFSEIPLTEGRNILTATATDLAGNLSPTSAQLVITLDQKPPELAVTKPANNQAFSGQDQRQIAVEGQTEATANVKVNGIQATVLADGTFRATLTAQAGSNKITVIATDKASNETKAELTVTWSP